jgi:hypothetical protein
MGEMRNAYTLFAQKNLKEKRSLERLQHIIFKRIFRKQCERVNCIYLADDKVH